jgi:glutaminyl-peptide cyclotransferase
MFRLKRFLFSVLVVFLLAYPSRQASSLGERKLPELSHKELLNLVSSPDPVKNVDPSNSSSHLSKILIPRVRKLIAVTSVLTSLTPSATAETDNSTIVRKYLISTLQALDWHIEEDEFINDTPLRPMRFTNVIATKDPSASRRVVLSAHYDSKYFPGHPDNQVCHPNPILLFLRCKLIAEVSSL